MKDRLGQLRLRFAGLRLAHDGDRVQVYAGTDVSGYEVSVAVPTERAATEPGFREAFAAGAGRARAAAASSTQSDPHAAVPWLAVRHPEGQAVIQRFVAELDRHRPAMPAGPVPLGPAPVDVPPPVRPDPTLAPMPPPLDPQPVAAPVPLGPIAPPPPAPAPPPPAPTPPARRRVPARPAVRVPRAVASAGQTRQPVRTATIVTLVAIVMGLFICCNAVLPNVLG